MFILAYPHTSNSGNLLGELITRDICRFQYLLGECPGVDGTTCILYNSTMLAVGYSVAVYLLHSIHVFCIINTQVSPPLG